jgi:DNA-binding MarR family transcriptional regulator
VKSTKLRPSVVPNAAEADGTAAAPLPLSALLSHVLVAFTIEFDNEFERHVPHRTTLAKHEPAQGGAPWLVSLAMYSNLLRFVPAGGVTIREFARAARLSKDGARTWLTRLATWWGYIKIDPGAAAGGADRAKAEWTVRLTPGGRAACDAWRSLFAEIERRWDERFGAETMAELRVALAAIDECLDAGLPDYLPILGYGLSMQGYPTPQTPSRAPRAGDGGQRDVGRGTHLSARLARVLLALALEFESDSELSLAICANVLRLLDARASAVRDLPRRSGVSKEAIAMALGILAQGGFAEIGSAAGSGRARTVRLTPRGEEAQRAYECHLRSVEKRWRDGFGEARIDALRAALERLTGGSEAERSTLLSGLAPHPGGWRARIRAREVLPEFPTVLHRGGWPDGA